MDYTDPASYGLRDLLLVLQLLHGAGLLDLEQVKAAPQKLDSLAAEWIAHKSTKLTRAQGGPQYKRQPTGKELVRLYEHLLQQYPDCANTTDLAYAVYYARIEQLETYIADRQLEASQILAEIRH